MNKNVAAVFVLLIFASCAGSAPYTSHYPLSADFFHSHDGTLTGKLPQGWFESTDDSIVSSLTVWLIREDFSATLLIKELSLDQRTEQQVRQNGLKLLANVSAGFQSDLADRGTATGIDPKEFDIDGKQFCSYETGSAMARKRIVVFMARGKYYECEARALKGNWTADDLNRMFSIQQSVLGSLAY